MVHATARGRRLTPAEEPISPPGGQVDDGADQGHLVGRKAAAPGVLEDDVLVGRDVDAIELVLGDVTLQPAVGPRPSLMTLFDLALIACNSSGDSFPAPGTSRSIRYWA